MWEPYATHTPTHTPTLRVSHAQMCARACVCMCRPMRSEHPRRRTYI